MLKIPIAVQLYSLREESAKDFEGTLKKVAELGFDGVEFAGFGNLTVQEVKTIIDDLGLQTAACHVPLEELENNLEQVIEEQKILGSKYLVCPYLMPERRTEKDYLELISVLNRVGERCQAEGITLCYHNHDFELEKLADGRTALKTLLEETNPELVQAELDIYWLTKAGKKPVEWINEYKTRTPLIHLKDMTTDEEQFFAELGTGGVDIEAVLNIGHEAGVKWWVVEQDVSRKSSAFESIEISMNYLKNRGSL